MAHDFPETAVFNEEGQIALRYKKQKPALVGCNGNQYYFSVMASISISYVDAEDADCLLGLKEGCSCGSGKKNNIIYADETHVRRWENGGGR